MDDKQVCKTCNGTLYINVSKEEGISQWVCKTCRDNKIIDAKAQLEKCYYDIIDIFKYYIDTTEENYKFMAMWIIGTYYHEEFNTFPYLFFNAMRGSGKTRTLKLISSLGALGDGSIQNNLTEAVLFRIPRGTTTCIDEVEGIGSKEKQVMRELLNSAYKKGMKVKRMKKAKVFDKEKGISEEKQIVEVFEPYFPICMANIWGVEEVLADRSIVLVLEKSNNPAKVKKIEDFDTNVIISNVKGVIRALVSFSVVSLGLKYYIDNWNSFIHSKYHTTNNITTQTTQTTLNNITTLKDIELDEFFNKLDDSGITGRNFELLFPLLLLAKQISDDVFVDFMEIAKSIVNKKKSEEYINSKDVSLFEFVDSMSNFGLKYIRLKELTERFRNFLGESDEEDKWLNDKWLGRALIRLNLLFDSKRVSSGREVILNYSKAKEKLKIFKVTEVEDD